MGNSKRKEIVVGVGVISLIVVLCIVLSLLKKEGSIEERVLDIREVEWKEVIGIKNEELDNKIVELQEQGGINYIEWGEKTYIVISSGMYGNTGVRVDAVPGNNSLTVGYWYDANSPRYVVIETNVSKDNIKCKHEMKDIVYRDIKRVCVVSGVSGDKAVLFNNEGEIKAKVADDIKLEEGIYELQFNYEGVIVGAKEEEYIVITGKITKSKNAVTYGLLVNGDTLKVYGKDLWVLDIKMPYIVKYDDVLYVEERGQNTNEK